MAQDKLASFKAYDIRGRVPDQLNPELVTNIGRGLATFLKPKRIAVGHDIRLSSPEFAEALCKGLQASGVDVVDIGRGGTEMVYFATAHLKLDGGVMVTASHNPADYNGLKLVREESKPISSDTGLKDIEQIILTGEYAPSTGEGKRESVDIHAAYVEHLLTYIDRDKLKPLKIVVNAGNGGAGAIIDLLEPHLPFEFIKIHHEPDGNFPNGIPNPLLPDNRQATVDAVRREKADFGIAWDGDYDRCFLFDENGEFIEGYYIVGLLAQRVLDRHPGATIIYDPRMTWNTVEIVDEAGGRPYQCKSGHAFIKEVMRREDAAYGGEMSAHHFFREFSYCDSGMIPWMLVAELIAVTGKSLADLVGERVERFPASGEINRRVEDARAVLEQVKAHYAGSALRVDETDGVGLDFADWRFNLRMSNTEPLIRLNVETRGDRGLLAAKTEEVLGLVGGVPA
ncbi:phosphomannomutase [Acidobacteria bacterium Mor1]|nr:phosphomannomutase [Acidobacteria bacterium Mor1]